MCALWELGLQLLTPTSVMCIFIYWFKQKIKQNHENNSVKSKETKSILRIRCKSKEKHEILNPYILLYVGMSVHIRVCGCLHKIVNVNQKWTFSSSSAIFETRSLSKSGQDWLYRLDTRTWLFDLVTWITSVHSQVMGI